MSQIVPGLLLGLLSMYKLYSGVETTENFFVFRIMAKVLRHMFTKTVLQRKGNEDLCPFGKKIFLSIAEIDGRFVELMDP